MVALPIRFFFSARVNKFLKRANSPLRSAFNRAQVGYRQQLIQLARPLNQPKQTTRKAGRLAPSHHLDLIATLPTPSAAAPEVTTTRRVFGRRRPGSIRPRRRRMRCTVDSRWCAAFRGGAGQLVGDPPGPRQGCSRHSSHTPVSPPRRLDAARIGPVVRSPSTTLGLRPRLTLVSSSCLVLCDRSRCYRRPHKRHPCLTPHDG
jgi:hypothetical protein